MVVHVDSEIPAEVSVIRKPLIEQKSYVVVKNHVREIAISDENKPSESSSDQTSIRNTDNEASGNVKKTQKRKKKANSCTSSASSADNTNKVTQISADDLLELKTAYKKCKAVVKKIETKYGHLLDLEEAGPSETCDNYPAVEEINECHCTFNKKIVFDDDGKQLTVDPLLDKHICSKKLLLKEPLEHKNIEIEYHDSSINLPDNLKELYSILRSSDIEVTYRNIVIDKVKSLRQEYLNEVKFNKHSLVEKLKANPDELLDFKGANLSALSGYS